LIKGRGQQKPTAFFIASTLSQGHGVKNTNIESKGGKAVNEKIHQPIAVTPHLFQLGVPSFPVYLSMGAEGMIIEGGTGPTADIIVQQIDELGIDPAKIKSMCLTHTHLDHVGAVPRLRRIWPHLKLLAGSVGAGLLQKDTFVQEFLAGDRMIGEILMERGAITAQPSPLDEYNFMVDAIIEEGERIDLGAGVVWHVFHTPGHSPCHISLVEEKEQTMVIGDMTGYFDPALDVFWPNYFASLEDYCNSIKKMTSVQAKRGLLSHNGVIEGNMRRHLQKALKATERYHAELLQRLDHGDDANQICTDKTDWVCSLGALASYKVIHFLCKLMLKQSAAAREKDLFYLPQADMTAYDGRTAMETSFDAAPSRID
jgi:glyoxylase-like metal-dependent hydrolase (beta-lactamase superfamily II)